MSRSPSFPPWKVILKDQDGLLPHSWTNQGFIKLTFAISKEETHRLFTFEIFLFFMFKSHLYFLFCELSVHILT